MPRVADLRLPEPCNGMTQSAGAGKRSGGRLPVQGLSKFRTEGKYLRTPSASYLTLSCFY